MRGQHHRGDLRLVTDFGEEERNQSGQEWPELARGTGFVIIKTEAANQWNYYQAKSSRQNLAELATHIPGVDAAHYKDEIERYKSKKEEVRKQAEKLEATSKEWDEKSEQALHQHHRWAQAMTAIQIAIYPGKTNCPTFAPPPPRLQ